jgi:DNA-directed RNA polymerase delta subunit
MMKLNIFVGIALVCCVAASLADFDEELNSASDPTLTKESLLDINAANTARRASYQGNVGTVYTHLNEIIRKILVHKKAWSVKYQADLERVAKEVAAAVAKESAARSGKNKADAALAVAKSDYNTKNTAWIKADAALKQKKKDAERERHDLGAAFKKGNGLKAGEIAMIVKIRCMLSEWNKDNKYSKGGKCVGEAPKDTLLPMEKLNAGQELKSSNGKYKAVMQGDGNFVIYDGGRAIWNTHTAGQNGAHFIFQNDVLVVYNKDHKAKWNSGTQGRKATNLVMQNDGNLVLYNGNAPVWSSKHGRA